MFLQYFSLVQSVLLPDLRGGHGAARPGAEEEGEAGEARRGPGDHHDDSDDDNDDDDHYRGEARASGQGTPRVIRVRWRVLCANRRAVNSS